MKILISCALAVLVSFVSGSSLAQVVNARTIRLQTELTEPIGMGNKLPSATMQIHHFPPFPLSRTQLEFTVRGLNGLRGDEVYGLYVTPASSAEFYVSGDPSNLRKLFNVDFNGTWHTFAGADPLLFDSLTITVFVVLEKDDGREFDPSLDLATVILEGTSTLPATPATGIVNGTFETGDLTGWTGSGINGGFAVVVQEGMCFSFNNTTGLTFNGDFAADVRSGGPGGPSSIGILTSDLFVAGSGISFRALSENDDGVPAADPVTLEVRVLDGVGNVLLSQIVTTNIVTLHNVFCPGGEPRDGIFSTHIVDTSALAGQAVRVEFRQHTDVPGRGFFTLIDDVAVNP